MLHIFAQIKGISTLMFVYILKYFVFKVHYAYLFDIVNVIIHSDEWINVPIKNSANVFKKKVIYILWIFNFYQVGNYQLAYLTFLHI